jgi:hypothetical protein
MQNESPGVEYDQEVFGSALDAAHGLMQDRGLEVVGDGPAQAAIAYDHVGDAPANERGRNAAAGGLYFRQLGHGWEPEKTLESYLILDSL